MKEYIVQAEHLIDMYGMRAIGELIRCKDCDKYKIYNDGYCPWIAQEVEEDFFCKDGKRKEE